MKYLAILLIGMMIFIPVSAQAKTFDIQIDILKTVDQLLALPFKCITFVLGSPAEDKSSNDSKPVPVNQDPLHIPVEI